MSVYTVVSVTELETFLGNYTAGRLLDYKGITDGIENTNYFVTTERGEFILTLFEQATTDRISYCLDLMVFLATHGFPSAVPIADRGGNYLRALNNRPTALVQRLAGRSVTQPDLAHVRVLRTTLGRLHAVCLDYQQHRKNERGTEWLEQTASRVRNSLNAGQRNLLDAALSNHRRFAHASLPRGVIHADLFRDNVLFTEHVISGLIDFYYSHDGALLYDLAVTVSDWCFDDGGAINLIAARALVSAYIAERTPRELERNAWIPCLRAVGLRFWLSRWQDKLFVRRGAITYQKDPRKFEGLLKHCESEVDQLNSVWP